MTVGQGHPCWRRGGGRLLEGKRLVLGGGDEGLGEAVNRGLDEAIVLGGCEAGGGGALVAQP
eukprot:3330335-Prymnesium_polylepis.1